MRASVDLPDPDSPTTPSVVPRGSPSVTSSTARKGARPIRKSLVTWSSRSTSPGGPAGGATGRSGVSRAECSEGAASSSWRVYACVGASSTCAVDPCSTTRPCCMTTIRSARSAATPRSCVMNRTDVPCSAVTSARWSRTVRCTVTSSAEVGSSAMTRCGRHANAMPMRTRCRMPPDSSCGYCRARSSGSAIPDRPRISTARAAAVRRSASPCARSTSAICSPMRFTGFSETVGSCGTSPTDLPRTRRSCLSDHCATSSPPSRTRPPVIAPPGGRSPITACARVLFPEPDSPTTATTSPASIRRSTPRTAATSPERDR